jgi:hypothetical protein
VHRKAALEVLRSNNPESHSRTKHIALRFFFLRDLIEWKQVVTGKVESELNPADLLTKHDDSFLRRRAMLGMTNKDNISSLFDNSEIDSDDFDDPELVEGDFLDEHQAWAKPNELKTNKFVDEPVQTNFVSRQINIDGNSRAASTQKGIKRRKQETDDDLIQGSVEVQSCKRNKRSGKSQIDHKS